MTESKGEGKATKNMAAFLFMVALSELGAELIKKSDNGYNVIVGSTASKPVLFSDYSDHPRKLVQVRPGLRSTAAGRYQILARYFDAYKKSLRLNDFSPASQDAIAMQMIKEQGAVGDIEAGRVAMAINKVRNIWASLPGAGYGQHENAFPLLVRFYQSAGGQMV